MKIIVKETDRLFSKLHKGKFVSEYLIYLDLDGFNVNIQAHIEIGVEAKNFRVNEMIYEYFTDENNNINSDGIVEEIPFEEINNKNKYERKLPFDFSVLSRR